MAGNTRFEYALIDASVVCLFLLFIRLGGLVMISRFRDMDFANVFGDV